MRSNAQPTDPRTGSSTTTGQVIALTADEAALIRDEGVSIIDTAGDEIAHAHNGRTVDEIEAAVSRVQLGVRLMRAAESGELPADDTIRAQLVRSQAGTVDELAGDTAALARLDARGVHGYVEKWSASSLAAMTVADLLSDINLTRVQAAKLESERDLFAAILGRWPTSS